MLKIKIKRLENSAKIPQRMSEFAAGYDVFANNSKNIILPSGKILLVGTGIALSLPPGYEAQIRPRSGLAFKHQIGILNSPGTIDADYRGEIKVILFNYGQQDFIIKPKMRIAQMVVSKHENLDFEITEDLEETQRGNGGFGHTKLI